MATFYHTKLMNLMQIQCLIILFTKVTSSYSAGLLSELKHVLPKLDAANNSFTDVRYNVGDTAFLPCHFSHYNEDRDANDNNVSSVSWIRRRDWQILSAGVYTYTIDDRFAVLYQEGSNDWTLQLKFVKLSDNGTYECQIHKDSDSRHTSKFVNLHVYKPRAIIDGPEDLHVSTGHSFTLSCRIDQVLSPPVYVMWLHKGQPLNYAPDRPRLTVLTRKGVPATSTLRIVNARYNDSGNYTCKSPNSASAYTMVYVSEGDNAAAIQRIESGQSSYYKSTFHFSSLLIIYSNILVNNIFSINSFNQFATYYTIT